MKKITLLLAVMAIFAMGSYAQNAWNQNNDSTYLIEGTTGDTVFAVRNGHVNIGGKLVQNPIDWDVDLEINDEDGIAILEMESFSEHTYLSLKAHSNTPWKGGFFSSRRSRGTYAAPLPVVAGDNLGSIDVHGWDGDQPSRGGDITFRVQGTVSDNIVPAQIAFTTVDQAGVWKERMTLMSSGDLSIGTGWTPTAAEVGARFYVKAATADATADAIEAVDASDNSLFVVRNDGNVGIGTTTPSSALHVVGTATATNYLGNGAGLTGITGATGGVANSGSTTIGADTDNDGVGEIALQTQLTTRMTIANDGNVGIGTNTPVRELHVQGTVVGGPVMIRVDNLENATDRSDAKIQAVSGGASGGDPIFLLSVLGISDWSIGTDNSDDDKFKIATSGSPSNSPRFTIDRTGNVGIGTTTPSSKLEVDGDIQADYFYFGDKNTNGNWRASTIAGKLTFEKRESGAWVVKVEMD